MSNPSPIITGRAHRTGDRWIVLTLFIFLFSLYLFTRSAALTSDGLKMALRAEAPSMQSLDFWNLRHLLWPAYGFTIYHAAVGLGYSGRSLELLQAANAFLEALGAALIYLLLRRTGAGKLLAASLSLTIGFSYFYWFFGTEIKYYPLTALGLVLTWLLLAPEAEFCRAESNSRPLQSTSSPGGTAGNRRAEAAGAAAGIGILMGLANLLLLPAAFLAIMADRSRSTRQRMLQADRFVAATLVAWLLPTITIGLTFNRLPPGQLLSWFMGVRNSVGYDVSNLGSNLQLFLQRFDEMVTGFRYTISVPYSLMFLWTNYFRFFLILVAVLVLIRMGALIRKRSFFFWGAIGMLVFYGSGIMLVDPYNDFRYILFLPIIMLAAAAGGLLEEEGKRWPGPAALVLALALFSINWPPLHAMSARYMERTHCDIRMNKMESYRPLLHPEDTVVVLGFTPDSQYYEYFLKVDVVNVLSLYQFSSNPRSALRALAATLDYRLRKGKRVFLDSEVFNQPLPYPVWAPRNMQAEQIKGFFTTGYLLEPASRARPNDELYRLKAHPGNIDSDLVQSDQKNRPTPGHTGR